MGLADQETALKFVQLPNVYCALMFHDRQGDGSRTFEHNSYINDGERAREA